MMAEITRQAPAKLNLGLEVVRRRPDGYHDLVTIFQTISLADTVSLRDDLALALTTNVPAIAGSDNLVLRALHELRQRSSGDRGARIELLKRIPLASGLGGASSDAAAALLAASELWRLPVTPDELSELALLVGSDVPFFLWGGTSLGTGRGERLEALHPLRTGWFVVVSPSLVIPRKTSALYGALTSGDFSAGDRVRQQAGRLRAGEPIDPRLLANAFERPLLAIAPELAALRDQMLAAGAPFVALSGAGPSHYTYIVNERQAQAIARELDQRLGSAATIAVCQPVVELSNIP